MTLQSGPNSPPPGLRFRSILVPHDFTAVSDLALERAAELVATSQGVIHLLHAVEPAAGFPSIDSALQITQSQAIFSSQRSADLRLRALGAGIDARVEVHVALGTPAIVICDFAEKVGADLIVMGTHGRRGVARLFRGDTAARTVRGARCPVFTLRSERVRPPR